MASPLFRRPPVSRPHGLVVPIRRDGVVLPVLCWWPAASDVRVRSARAVIRASRVSVRPDRPLLEGREAQIRAAMWRAIGESDG